MGQVPQTTNLQKADRMSTATMEPQTIPLRSISLQFSDASEIHAGIENAVTTLIDAARQDGSCGIRVTRLEPGAYTVALDESVPFGETYEIVAA